MRNKHFADITQYKQEHQHRTINTKKKCNRFNVLSRQPCLKPIKLIGLGGLCITLKGYKTIAMRVLLFQKGLTEARQTLMVLSVCDGMADLSCIEANPPPFKSPQT